MKASTVATMLAAVLFGSGCYRAIHFGVRIPCEPGSCVDSCVAERAEPPLPIAGAGKPSEAEQSDADTEGLSISDYRYVRCLKGCKGVEVLEQRPCPEGAASACENFEGHERNVLGTALVALGNVVGFIIGAALWVAMKW